MELKIGLEGEGGEDGTNAERRVIEIHGSLDLYNVQSATQSVRPFLEENGVALVVDLDALEFVDSSGIGMLFSLETSGGKEKRTLWFA